MKNVKNTVFYILIFVFSLQIFNENPLAYTGECKSLSTPKRPLRIAICYWGLTRSTKKVYQSHFKNIFDVLSEKNVQFDVFMHTWHTTATPRVQIWEIDQKIDYEEYKLLKPKYYRIDDQDFFTENLEFDKYFYKDVWDEKGHALDGEWLPKLILNHLCALESQKRVTEMVIESEQKYDLIMYVRPDALLRNKFPFSAIKNLREGEIIIPDFDHCEGYNDRFAVLHYNTAPLYAKRIEGIIDYRKTQGRIVSEKYVKYICDVNKFNVIFINFKFNLIRP